MNEKKYDIVVYGATSFVGQIISHYMVKQYGCDNLRWAIAGRSMAKLMDLKQSLGSSAENLAVLTADANDLEALTTLCHSTQVILSTVGPYDLYGEPLVQACCQTGTDYCDLTGEMHWIKRMQEKYIEVSVNSGARIVHACGFDSIPSDCGVHFLQKHSAQQHGKACSTINMGVKRISGGLSGGTIASMLNMTKQIIKDPSLRKELGNPYSCCPPNHGFTARQANITVAYDEHAKSWLAPFMMAAINTRIVHRSNALSGKAYGEQFYYQEATLTGDSKAGEKRAKRMATGFKLFNLATAISPIRWLLERFVLAKPGEGPSPEEQLNGEFDLRFRGQTAQGEVVKVKVTGDRDPGYGSTAKMISQAAMCLAFDIDQQTPGGFWTPATLLGDTLIERLQTHAGLTFEVLGD